MGDSFCRIMVIIFPLSLVYTSANTYRPEYLEDNCDKTIKLNTSTLFELTKEIFYRRGWRCTTTLETTNNHVILLNFVKFDVGRPSLMFCTDVLRIYDGPDIKSKELSPVSGHCGRSVLKPYESSGYRITFKFKSGYVGMGSGFKVLTTVGKRNKNGKCEKSMFKCEDGYCIDMSLVCDGMNNCLDGSDEIFQHAKCSGPVEKTMTQCEKMAVVEKLGMCVGVAALLLIVVFVCSLLVRFRQARRKRHD